MESTVFIANYNDSCKMNACAESDRTNHSRPNKAELIGQNTENKRDSCRVLTHELDGTPHSSYKGHSSIDFKFMFYIHCNLQ
jgi:hypothetical protein